MLNAKTRARRDLIGISLLVISCSVAACSRSGANDSEPTPVLSGPPPTAFPMPPVSSEGSMGVLGWTLGNGNRSSLSEQRGKVLVLDFYATWCEPCRESIPHLNRLHQRYEGSGLALVGLNVGGPDDRVKVAGFATEFGIAYPLGFPDKALTDLLLADDTSIPQTFVFDREGKLINRYIGYDETMHEHLEKLIVAKLNSGARISLRSYGRGALPLEVR